VRVEVLTAVDMEITVRFRGSQSRICGDYREIRGSHDGYGVSSSRV
jgi:hypothetical protein